MNKWLKIFTYGYLTKQLLWRKYSNIVRYHWCFVVISRYDEISTKTIVAKHSPFLRLLISQNFHLICLLLTRLWLYHFAMSHVFGQGCLSFIMIKVKPNKTPCIIQQKFVCLWNTFIWSGWKIIYYHITALSMKSTVYDPYHDHHAYEVLWN